MGALQNNTTGTYNTAIGQAAGQGNTTGSSNISIGVNTNLSVTTASSNIAVGTNALYNNTSAENVGIGKDALKDQTSGSDNTAVGTEAFSNNTTGAQNTGFGKQAGYSTTTGSNNTAVGFKALRDNQTGSNNTAVGASALDDNTGGSNTAVGYETLRLNIGGNYNTAMGVQALYNNDSASGNTAIGYYALNKQDFTSATDSYNTAVGFFAGKLSTTGTKNTFVGALTGDAITTAGENTAAGYSALSESTSGSKNTCIGQLSGSALTSGGGNTFLGGYTGNQSNLDLRTVNNNIVLSRGDGTPHVWIQNQNFRLGAGYEGANMLISSCISTSTSGGSGSSNRLELEFMEPSSPNFGAKKVQFGVRGGGYVNMKFPGSGGLYMYSPYSDSDTIHLGYSGIILDNLYGGYSQTSNITLRSVNGIVFCSGGTGETARFDSNKRLGIGTTTPQHLLDVDGTIRHTSNIVSNTVYKAFTIGSDRTIDDYGGLNKDYWAIQLATPGANTDGQSSGHAYGALKFSGVSAADTTLDDVLVLNYTGKVGIGTSNPVSTLHINATGTDLIRLDKNGSQIGTITENGGQLKIDSTSNILMQANSGASSIRFRGTLRPLVNNSDDIGTSSRRFKDLYLSGTVNSNGLSALNSGSGDCSVQIKSTSAGDPKLIFDSDAANRSGVIQFRDQGANVGRIEYVNNGDRIDMRAGSATGITMSVLNGGVLVGKTVEDGTTAGVRIQGTGETSICADGNVPLNVNLIESSAGGTVVEFRKSGTLRGSIGISNYGVSYNTTSDQRLKDNIQDAPSASTVIDNIKVRQFDWNVDGTHENYGMIAQELSTVVPEAVSSGKKSTDMMGVDYSKLVPLLVKEIQELRQRVAQLEE